MKRTENRRIQRKPREKTGSLTKKEETKENHWKNKEKHRIRNGKKKYPAEKEKNITSKLQWYMSTRERLLVMGRRDLLGCRRFLLGIGRSRHNPRDFPYPISSPVDRRYFLFVALSKGTSAKLIERERATETGQPIRSQVMCLVFPVLGTFRKVPIRFYRFGLFLVIFFIFFLFVFFVTYVFFSFLFVLSKKIIKNVIFYKIMCTNMKKKHVLKGSQNLKKIHVCKKCLPCFAGRSANHCKITLSATTQ